MRRSSRTVRTRLAVGPALLAAGALLLAPPPAASAREAAPDVRNGDLLFTAVDAVASQAPGRDRGYTAITEGVNATYSPDATEIAFARDEPLGPTAIVVRDLASGDERTVTELESYWGRTYVDFSPDGERLVVAGEGDDRLLVVDVATGAATSVYDAPSPIGHPAWSPDGSRIAFDVGGAIRLVRPDGTDLRTLTAVGRNSAPDWRPDSRALAFVTTRYDGSSEVVTLPRSGKGQPVRVSHLAYPQGIYHLDVAWSPDGRKIAVLQFNRNSPPDEEDSDERFKVRGYLPDGSRSFSLTGPITGDDGPEGLDWGVRIGR